MIRFFFVAISLLLISCSSNTVISTEIIPKSKMETVLWQLMQADEFFTNYIIKDSSKNTTAERTKLYQQVFALNKITKEEFRKSYDFYIHRPEISRPMFDSLAARGGRNRGNVYGQTYAKKDSLPQDSSQIPLHRLLKLRRDTLK
jgi:hypothetical protein